MDSMRESSTETGQQVAAHAFEARGLRVASWFAIAVVLVASPIVLTYILQPGSWRSLGVEVGVAAGFLAMAIMCGQFATTGRSLHLAKPIGLGLMMKVHLVCGIVALVLVLLHPIVLFLSDRDFLEYLDPRVNLPRAASLTLVTILAVVLVVLPLVRKRIGPSYEWWRVSHAALAAMVVLIGIGHMNMVGHHIEPIWKRGLWIAITAVAVGMLCHVRLVRPWMLRRRPWRVTKVREEHERTWTLVLEPDGHDGIRFDTGQHAWLTINESPFALQQHPFTIASSDTNPRRIELTIKALGDFTSTVGGIQPGTRAYLEGPYGASWIAGSQTTPLIMIAGGIGITPFASVLRTMHERGVNRPFLLIHGSDTLDKATFHDELHELAAGLGGRVINVLESPPSDADSGWSGETGYITRELLERVLDQNHLHNGRFVLCGPGPMLEMVAAALRSLGVRRKQIHLEQFDMV